ncbi:hypothetical protein IMG5_029090 [Ichthyophthirius multifiliis]|uniref:Dynein axonemal assembly factor 5 HEAT-repeat domain-containing protein n=1 Tax=Ichthyophthirius multifiliis TaxID=5932 RepID=G0QLD6_ICHMU|nr:hypothetical protein IMG5_029090 [Ichthyophthirius multifiliis]EGR33969.1 hypothetical protein IMG5_029090 [Ichthyophthirius multifiliis]|eukprot:XP_004039273.1 hypothetical protein IMG5_029090 [Ichthyophthirius multifiliis]
MIVLAESDIKEHLKDIVKTLVKYLDYEDIEIQNTTKKISELLGIYLEIDIYMPLIISSINDEEHKSAPKSLKKLLAVLSMIIRAENPKSLEPHLEAIMKTIMSIEKTFDDNEDVQGGLYYIIKELIEVGGENISIYCRPIFSLLLTIEATTKIGTKLCGYQSISELHSNEVSMLLNEFTQNQSYKSWQKYSKDRLKFDIIIRNCGEGIEKFMDIILEILQSCVDLNQDVEVRLDTLIQVEFLIQTPYASVQKKLYENSQIVLTRIIIPSIIWRIGKPQIKIRKAGVINLYKMIEKNLLDKKVLVKCLNELMPPIKSSLSDDWAPDLRLAACKLMEKILLEVQNDIQYIQISENYTALLERLDDSQDIIRIEICKSFIAIFGAKALKESTTIFDYMIKAIFIHLDDQNEEMQMAAYNSLRFAAHFNSQILKNEATQSIKKMKFPRKCQELINLADQLLSEQQSDQMEKEQEQQK